MDLSTNQTKNKNVLSLINDFEDGEWRQNKFNNFVWDNIAETALSFKERNCLINQNHSTLVQAAKNLRLTDKEKDEKGQGSKLGEIVLYGIMKHNTIPELIEELTIYDIGVDKFFKLERLVSYQLSAIMADINELQKLMLGAGVDISPFVSKLSYAFLPPVVFQLEEYGLPRMISKKLHNHNIFDFLDAELTIHTAINKFHILEGKIREAEFLDEFDRYIINYFYDGITLTDMEQQAFSQT